MGMASHDRCPVRTSSRVESLRAMMFWLAVVAVAVQTPDTPPSSRARVSPGSHAPTGAGGLQNLIQPALSALCNCWTGGSRQIHDGDGVSGRDYRRDRLPRIASTLGVGRSPFAHESVIEVREVTRGFQAKTTQHKES